ncbi:MAG: type II toxin-antitoxin system RelE/ParE family toxin [Lachnospirales bacterium]
MYTVEYLPVAKNDMVGIINYISNDLQIPLVADRFADEMIEKIESLSLFPYSNSVYFPVRQLKKEYRKLLIKNFIVFYYIVEQSKVVTVARVLYNKRNISGILD